MFVNRTDDDISLPRLPFIFLRFITLLPSDVLYFFISDIHEENTNIFRY